MMEMHGLSTAAKIMEKWGFKAGEGLGKNSQGIKQALVVQQISRHKAKIVKVDKEEEEPSLEWEEEREN